VISDTKSKIIQTRIIEKAGLELILIFKSKDREI